MNDEEKLDFVALNAVRHDVWVLLNDEFAGAGQAA
jgi:hypothetical protein